MASRFLIYGLIDPRSGELRYVGKSCSGMKRPGQHSYPYFVKRDACTHVGAWVLQLHAAGLKPDVEVLETHETAEALVEAERHFIAYFRSIGCRLTNLTDGGEGRLGFVTSDATKTKLSEALRGTTKSTEVRAKMSAGKKGAVLSEQHKGKLRAATLRFNARPPIVDQHGRVYVSTTDAGQQLGLLPRSVASVVSGRRASVHGYTFRHVSETCCG